jgi:hypothetical protein
MKRFGSAYVHETRFAPLNSRLGAYITIAFCLPLLAGCAERGMVTAVPQVAVTTAPQVAITTNQLVGKWGLASYRTSADRTRTETAARAACSNPYVVTNGATGGVMMYVAARQTG